MQKRSTVDAVLGNWRLSGITTLQSGRPFSVGASNNPIAGAGSARADLVGAGYPVLDPDRSKGEKLDAVFRQDPIRQSGAEHLWHARAKCAVRTGIRQCGHLARQGLAAAVLR